MTGIRRRRGWEIPDREATPEEVFLNRRRFLRSAGLAGLGLAAGCGSERTFAPFEPEEEGEASPAVQAPAEPDPVAADPDQPLYPAKLNPGFATLDRPLTEEEVASSYNNFYEFTQSKQVYLFVDDLRDAAPGRWRYPGSSKSRRPGTSTTWSAACRWRSGSTASAASRHGRWRCRGRGFRCGP